MRLSVILLAGVAFALPASAQELNVRVGKLESEMRAVQRKVFPNGQYVEPQIEADRPAPGPGPGTPASTPIADLSQRVSSLEQQMTTLTGQSEEQDHRLRRLEEDFAAYRRATDTRLTAGPVSGGPMTGGAAPSDVAGYGAPTSVDRSPPRDPRGSRASAPTSDTPAPRPTPAKTRTVGPDHARALAAIQRPDTGDAAEDAYMYGYRLWEGHFYPEAEAALKGVVATYPRSKRASYAQNLLGRAYFDEGKASLAAPAFYDSYKKFPEGERAPDSLYYLAQTLMKLNKPADACKVYGELSEVYGSKTVPPMMSAQMKANVAKGRVAAKCS